MFEDPWTPTTEEGPDYWAEALVDGVFNPEKWGDVRHHDRDLALLQFKSWFAAEIAKAQAHAVTEAAIIEWMGRHSSAAISRLLHHGHDVLDTRFADGVFE